MTSPGKHTFPKAERLKSRKQIDLLFRSGKSFSAFPLKVFYHWQGSDQPKVGVGVPKRHFKRAVDRNRIKRLMREAYRLQKQTLVDAPSAPGLNVFIIFTGKEIPVLAGVMDKMAVTLKRLANEKS